MTAQAVTIAGGSGAKNLGAVSIFTTGAAEGIHSTTTTGAISATGDVNSAGAAAINIAGTSGATRTPLNINLTSLAANGGTKGLILLNTSATGSPGGFRVNGTGTTDGSGGTIQNTTRAFPTPLKQALCTFGLPWAWPGAFAWADIYHVSDQLLRTRRDAQWLCGAFLFIRAIALREVGGHLDNSFFFYGEDIELCFRFHRHNWRVHYDPAAAITHIGGSSSDPTRVDERLKNAYVWQARYRIQRVCYGRAAAAFVRACDVIALSLRKAKLFLSGQRRTDRYRSVSDALSILLKPLRT